MYPFGKDLDRITAEDIVTLTEPENVRLDYKGDLSNPPRWKDEFRKDVTAFANTAGGVLILGVFEDNKVPVRAEGVRSLAGKNTDKIEQELGNALEVWIEPRIPGLKVRAIPKPDTDLHFVVVVVPSRSWAAPHWVQLEESRGFAFYIRLGTSNRAMKYGDVERAFRERVLALQVDISCEADHLERTKPITLCTQADH